MAWAALGLPHDLFTLQQSHNLEVDRGAARCHQTSKFVPPAAMRTFDDMLSVVPFDVTHWRRSSAFLIHASEFLSVRDLSLNRARSPFPLLLAYIGHGAGIRLIRRRHACPHVDQAIRCQTRRVNGRRNMAKQRAPQPSLDKSYNGATVPALARDMPFLGLCCRACDDSANTRLGPER